MLFTIRQRWFEEEEIVFYVCRVGNWLHGDRVIADFIRKGFMELFTSNLCSVSLADWNPPFWHTYLSEEETTSIDSVVIEEEIITSIWGLKPFKAPGPNGLHVGFFQRFWLIVGETVKKEVNSIFTTGKCRNTLTRHSLR